MTEIDWYEMACDPGVEELGAILRGTVASWVGFLDLDGLVVPVGDRAESLTKPPCEQIRANSLEDSQGDVTSCDSAVRDWADRVVEEGKFRATCHAGFEAGVWPIRSSEGAILGAMYVSGVLDASRADQQRGAIEQRIDENGLSPLIPEGAVRDIPVLGESEWEFVEHVVERMRRRVRVRLEGEGEPMEDLLESSPTRFEGMIGETSVMRELFEEVATIAESDSTVLIEGENGTGKELIAQALHRRSPRSTHEFVPLNCAAIPSELVESELFGHRKGAFSGAHRDREGLCVEADRGTLFLDEIGEMDRSLQSKLLRFLQDGRFTPVGSNKARSVDVRVLCATNRDLGERVEAGEFRKDLYFRINVIELRVPPLRERRGDIPLLIDHFLHKSAKRHGIEPPRLTEECRSRLVGHDWPGNVRELENEMERLVIMAGGGDAPVEREALSARIDERATVESIGSLEGLTIPEATERLERRMILEGLRETGWNKTQAAKNLGISRRNLIRKVSEYDLEDEREE